jgi:phytoene synthase
MTLTYSANFIRQHDPDRFLISLLAPRQHRAALWVLFAFNYEIAKTREVVSDTTIGLIRLQWWRDALSEIYDGKAPRKHEVVTPLADVIKRYDLPQELFDNLIYAREFDLEGVAPASLEGLLSYCDFTTTPLTQLALMILGESEEEEVVRAVSTHYALLGTLRAVPYMLGKRHVMIPQDILGEHDLNTEKICDFNKKADLVKIIEKMLLTQKQLRNDELLITSRFIHSMNALSNLYEKRIEKFGFDVFDPKFHAPMPLKALSIWIRVILK